VVDNPARQAFVPEVVALGAVACLAAVVIGHWTGKPANGPRISRQASSPDA